jgi:integral membrane protein
VKLLATTYRVLAYVVGVLLAFCALTSILKYGAPEGSSLQQFGEDMAFMWAFHGFIYMAYFVVALLLAVRAGWTMTFTLVMLAAGLIPLLMFWVERVVAHKLRSENADELGLDELDQPVT